MVAPGLTATTRRLEIAARDRRTLEVRQFFHLPRVPDATTRYATHLYFYFPRGFGISPTTWGHDAFYRDAHIYMRLHAPDLRLRDLADLEHPTNPASILRRQLPMLLEADAPTGQSLETLAKTLGAELADAATSATRELAQRLRDAVFDEDKTPILRDMERVCSELLRALGAARRLRAKSRAYRTVAPPSLMPALAFAEEYASAVIDERIAELARVVDEVPQLRDGTATAVRMRVALARTAEQITLRRLEQGFPVPSGDSPEYFTYRLGLLKKEMQRALYVDSRGARSDPFWRNSVAMVAAGLAATWATLAQIPLLQGGLSTQQSVLLFTAAVFAYVLKDRIKEWSRVVLTKKLLRWDHNQHIIGDALSCAGLGAVAGRAFEVVRWVKDEEIPRAVRALRSIHRTVRGVAPDFEHGLHPHRVVAFEGVSQPVPDGFGVQELFRVSLDEVLKRLDDPVDEVAYYDPERATFDRADMPKVYHLNLVATATEEHSGQTVIGRWRVVVNQQGIVHIDPVVERHGNIQTAPILIEAPAE